MNPGQKCKNGSVKMKQRNAARDNAHKAPLGELGWFDWSPLAWHCHIGRKKYPDVDGKPNWILGGKPDSEYIDAALRHLMKMAQGETRDSETGTLHAAAVQWNMGALVTLNYCLDGTDTSTSHKP